MNYAIISDKLTSPGVLNVEFTLPCGFSWGGSPLELGGQSPVSLDIIASGNETIVTASYNLPMHSTWVFTQFEVDFTCDPNCGPGLGACVIHHYLARSTPPVNILPQRVPSTLFFFSILQVKRRSGGTVPSSAG